MIAGNSRPVPPGAPSWITPELIAQTIETWQPYYRDCLTEQDSLDILLGVGRLFEILLGSKS